jgi:hypothetical protein
MCKSCEHTHLVGAEGFKQPIDPVKLAKYQRAKRTGKIPADPAYPAHVAASWYVPNLEFTRAELKDKSVKLFKRDPWAPNERSAKADRFFPGRDVTDIKSYVSMFERLNNLVPTNPEV